MPRLSETQLSWVPAPLASGVTTVMENVKLGLLPAALQEDVGGGALSGGGGPDTPTKVSAAHFFKESLWRLMVSPAQSLGKDQSKCFLFLVAQDPELVTVWGNS